MEMMNGGIRNVAGTFLSLEADALRNLPDFRNKCTELKHRQASVLELVVGRAIQNGEIKSDIIPSVIADLFMNVVIGQNYRSNVEGSRYYTDGMLRQFNYKFTKPLVPHLAIFFCAFKLRIGKRHISIGKVKVSTIIYLKMPFGTQ